MSEDRITESDVPQVDWDPRESLDDPHLCPVCRGADGYHKMDCPDRPVRMVSWAEAMDFANAVAANPDSNVEA